MEPGLARRGGRREERMRRFAALMMVVVFLAACVPGRPEVAPAPGPEVGRPVPDFGWATEGGGEESLSDFRGRVVVLVFWNPACRACQEQIAALERVQGDYNDRVVIIGVSRRGSTSRLGFRDLIDEKGQLFGHFWVKAVPTLFFVDGDGVIRVRHEGGLSVVQIDRILRELGVR